MGHRANFVVIRDGKARAYYDQCAALGCLYFFAAGPDPACAELSSFEETDGLMDWAYAEGGYLIDLDQRTAIAFGFVPDPRDFGVARVDPLNSAFKQGPLALLNHIGPNWIGWRLVWDDHSVDAFAAYLRNRRIADVATQPSSHPPDTAEAIEYSPSHRQGK